MSLHDQAAITEQQFLSRIAVVSEVIIKHGVRYAPLLDRLERELSDLRNVDDPRSRARRLLARAAEVKASSRDA